MSKHTIGQLSYLEIVITVSISALLSSPPALVTHRSELNQSHIYQTSQQIGR